MGLLGKKITKLFGQPAVHALDNVDFSIEAGEFVAITGRSGSGKSTLLYIMSTLDTSTSGDFEVDGKNIHTMNDFELHEFRNQKMGFVFQFHYLLPELTSLENVLMPARKTDKQELLRENAKQLLAEMGLAGKEDRLPKEMSGGEQQRVAIARALIMKPRYIFADEPTGNLDTTNGDLVIQILKRITAQGETAVIMVTHDPDYAAAAHRRIHLVDGHVTQA